MTTDPTEKIEETETGYRATIKSTRGTGTRDQDKVEITAKTETLSQLEDELPRLENAVKASMNNRRAHQPDTEDED